MRLRPAIVFCLFLVPVMPASAQDHSYRIFNTFTGRFHCGGQWRDFQLHMAPVSGPLGIVDDENELTASITFYFYRSVTSLDGASYKLAGRRDLKTGRFHLEPKELYGSHPAVFEMIGIEGTFDAATQKMTAKMLSDKCDAVEVAGPGGKLSPLPSQPAPPASADAANNARPEKLVAPSNVTNYLDVAAYNPDFEYWVTAWSDPPGAV